MSTQTVAPTPSAPYNPAERVSPAPSAPEPRNAELAAALSRRAGQAPARVRGEPTIIPGQPPKAPLGNEPAPTAPAADAPPSTKNPPPSDDSPAPHVKFIAADDQEPAKPAPPSDEPSPEVIKHATPQLREAYEKLKSDFSAKVMEYGASKKELDEFRAKAKGYEERLKAMESIEARARDAEAKALALDERLRITNYTEHEEFHEKYTKPVSEAMAAGVSLVSDLIVNTDDGPRTGTAEDFHEVLSQPNTTLAANKAEELFGSKLAGNVVEARARVRAAREARTKAMNNAAKDSLAWQEKQAALAAEARSQARANFAKASQALAEKYAHLYLPPEGDKEAAAARQQGEALANIFLEGAPEGMSQEEQVTAIAKIHHRASAFPVQLLRIQRLEQERDALAAKLAAYEKSTPDAEGRKGVAGAPGDAGGVPVGGPDLSAQMRASLEKYANSSERSRR